MFLKCAYCKRRQWQIHLRLCKSLRALSQSRNLRHEQLAFRSPTTRPSSAPANPLAPSNSHVSPEEDGLEDASGLTQTRINAVQPDSNERSSTTHISGPEDAEKPANSDDEDAHVQRVTSHQQAMQTQLVPSKTYFTSEISEDDRRFLRKASKILWDKRREDKRAVNQVLRDKGDWSHDWRTPLRLLRENTTTEPDETLNWKQLKRLQSTSSLAPTKRRPLSPTTFKRPIILSRKSFTYHVRDLVLARHVRPLIWHLSLSRSPEQPPSTIPEIAWALLNLFRNVSLRKFTTPEAGYMAIKYLINRSLIQETREMFFLLEHLSFGTGTHIINVMMRRAARNKDLHAFAWLLQNMTKRGLKANAETWCNFLLCIENQDVRSIILQEMERLGFAQYPAQERRIFASLLKDDLKKLLESNEDLNEHLANLERKRGPEWLSGTVGAITGNHIIYEARKYLSRTQMFQLINSLMKWRYTPNSSTVNMLLSYWLRLGSFPSALQVLNVASSQWHLRITGKIYGLLFQHAWRKRWLNVCHVVWKAACFDGAVTWNMQRHVADSLRLSAALHQRALDPNKHLTTPLWQQLQFEPPEGRKLAFMSVLGRLLVDIPAANPSSSVYHRKQLTKSLSSASEFQLGQPFPELLSKAFAMDMIWLMSKEEGVAAKLEKALPIPTIPPSPPLSPCTQNSQTPSEETRDTDRFQERG